MGAQRSAADRARPPPVHVVVRDCLRAADLGRDLLVHLERGSPSRSLRRFWRCLPARPGRDGIASSCSGWTVPAGTARPTWLCRMGSGSPTCPHTRPSFSRLNTSGPSSTSHSPTSTSRRLLISSTSSPSAVAFSIAISSNRAQTSTGGPSQTSRPNQPESVSLSPVPKSRAGQPSLAGAPRPHRRPKSLL